MGSSFSSGPIAVDRRTIGLGFDLLLMLSIGGLAPATFTGYSGSMPGHGSSAAALHVPGIPAAVGLRIYTAFVTLDSSAPSGIRSISDTHAFTITNR